jgi:hypothetical protein
MCLSRFFRASLTDPSPLQARDLRVLSRHEGLIRMESRAEKFTDVWRMNCVTQRHEVHPVGN